MASEIQERQEFMQRLRDPDERFTREEYANEIYRLYQAQDYEGMRAIYDTLIKKSRSINPSAKMSDIENAVREGLLNVAKLADFTRGEIPILFPPHIIGSVWEEEETSEFYRRAVNFPKADEVGEQRK